MQKLQLAEPFCAKLLKGNKKLKLVLKKKQTLRQGQARFLLPNVLRLGSLTCLYMPLASA